MNLRGWLHSWSDWMQHRDRSRLVARVPSLETLEDRTAPSVTATVGPYVVQGTAFQVTFNAVPDTWRASAPEAAVSVFSIAIFPISFPLPIVIENPDGFMALGQAIPGTVPNVLAPSDGQSPSVLFSMTQMVAAPGHQQLWPGPVLIGISPAPSLLLESPNRQSAGVAYAAQPALTGIALTSSLLLDSPNRQGPGVADAAQPAARLTTPGPMQLAVRVSPWPALASDTDVLVSNISAGNATEQPAPRVAPVHEDSSAKHGWGGWPAEDGLRAAANGAVALDAAISEIQPPAATGNTVASARQTTDAADTSKGFNGGHLVEISCPTTPTSREAQPACELGTDWPTWTAGGGLLVVWLRKVLFARSAVRRSGKTHSGRTGSGAAD